MAIAPQDTLITQQTIPTGESGDPGAPAVSAQPAANGVLHIQPGESLTPGERWNRDLQRLEGNLLQSWRWGEFKQRQGWGVERIHGRNLDGEWMAQILFKRAGPLSLAYIPGGPTLGGNHEAVFPRLLDRIDEVCRSHRTFTLVMEPNQRFDLRGTYKSHGLVAWVNAFQPRQTIQIPVRSDEDQLAALRKDTRQNVRQAIKQGITVARAIPPERSLDIFYAMSEEVSRRKRTKLLPRTYFGDLLRAFEGDASLFVARDGEIPVAAAIFLRFGDAATCMFSGSSAERRGKGANAYLRYEAMRTLRDEGCTEIDLGNIEPEGLRTFKSGFGGIASTFPIPMERRYRPIVSWFARRALSFRGAL